LSLAESVVSACINVGDWPMSKKIAFAALSALLFAAPALARDVAPDWGRNTNRNAIAPRPHNNGWSHHHQHPGKWRGHDHFSPRGQGGHHWGW
jgi:hypothetical protein